MPPFRIVLAALAAISTCGYAADGAPLKLTIAIDGAPLEVDLREPGRPAQMSFQARAGQRLGLGIAGLQLAPASVSGVSFVVRQPDGSLLPRTKLLHCLPPIGASSQEDCDTGFTIERTGAHLIEIDPPFSASSRFTATLSTPATRVLSVDKAETIAITRVGQDARLSVDLAAGSDLSIEVRDVASKPEQPFAVRVYRPDGTKASESVAASSRGVSLPIAGPAGTYVVEVDPAKGALGTFVAVARAAAALTLTTAPREFSSSNPSEVLGFVLQAGAGQSFSVAIDAMKFTPAVESNVVLAVNNPDGTRLKGLGCSLPAKVPCKVGIRNLPAAGKYTVAISSPMGATVSGRLLVAEEVTGTINADAPVRVELKRPSQVARYTFPGTAGDVVSIALADVAAAPSASVVAKLERPEGFPMLTQMAMQGALKTNPVTLPVTGTYSILVDAGTGMLDSATLSITKIPKAP